MRYLHLLLTLTLGILVGILVTTKALTCRPMPTYKPNLQFDDSNTPGWCLPVEVKFDDEIQTGMACSQTELLCYKVEATAKKLGGLGGIQSIGECNEHHFVDWISVLKVGRN